MGRLAKRPQAELQGARMRLWRASVCRSKPYSHINIALSVQDVYCHISIVPPQQ